MHEYDLIIRSPHVQIDNIFWQKTEDFTAVGYYFSFIKPGREYEYFHFVLNPLTKTLVEIIYAHYSIVKYEEEKWCPVMFDVLQWPLEIT